MLLAAVFFCATSLIDAQSATIRETGLASWYGEAHRGRLMANGRKFDPDKLTAASWFYPLGTRVRVTAMEKLKLTVEPVPEQSGG